MPQLGHGLAGAAQRPRALGGRPRAILLDAGVHGARAARLLDTCHVHSRSSINALTHNYLYQPLRRLSTRRFMPAFAAERWRLQHCAHGAPIAIDRYLLRAGRSLANPPHAAAAVERWDRQTDRRPDGHSTVTYYAGVVKSTV